MGLVRLLAAAQRRPTALAQLVAAVWLLGRNPANRAQMVVFKTGGMSINGTVVYHTPGALTEVGVVLFPLSPSRFLSVFHHPTN